MNKIIVVRKVRYLGTAYRTAVVVAGLKRVASNKTDRPSLSTTNNIYFADVISLYKNTDSLYRIYTTNRCCFFNFMCASANVTSSDVLKDVSKLVHIRTILEF